MNGTLNPCYILEHFAKSISLRIKILMMGLFILDLFLLGANVLHHMANAWEQDGILLRALQWPYWAGGPDGSIIELAGHVKMLVAAAMLLLLGKRLRSWLFLAWATVLTAMAIDDFFLLHEHTGDWFTRTTGPWSVMGMRSQDVGQLLFWSAAAAVLGIFLLWAHFKASSPMRASSHLMFGCVALLAVFEVGVDAIHAVLDSVLGSIGNGVLNLGETAGGLISMSVILVVAALIFEHWSLRSAAHGEAFADEHSLG